VFQPIIAYLVLAQAVFRVEYGSLILLINQWEANPNADACKEALFNRLFCDDMHRSAELSKLRATQLLLANPSHIAK